MIMDLECAGKLHHALRRYDLVKVLLEVEFSSSFVFRENWCKIKLLFDTIDLKMKNYLRK